MDSIAKTSLLTAAMRAVESARTGDRLFFDPYAALLAGAEGMDLLQRAIDAAGDQPAVAIRTKYFDDQIEQALLDGVRQIVIFAAGMDTRAFRLDIPNETTVFELDRAEVFEYKQSKLNSTPARCRLKYLPLDLKLDWRDQLRKSGFQYGLRVRGCLNSSSSRREEEENRSLRGVNEDFPTTSNAEIGEFRQPLRTLWLVEGLLMYLEKADVTVFFDRLKGLALQNDLLLCDILGESLLNVPHMDKQLKFLSGIGAPWKFGTDEPKEFLGHFGWDVSLTQAGDCQPARWPFPVTPLSVPNAPRGYFVRAVKKA